MARALTPRLAGNGARARCDVRVENHGTIVLVRPITVTGQDWCDYHMHYDHHVGVFGGAIVVEPRFVDDIVRGMINDGLVVI